MKRPAAASSSPRSRLPLQAVAMVALITMGPSSKPTATSHSLAFAPVSIRHNRNSNRRRMPLSMMNAEPLSSMLPGQEQQQQQQQQHLVLIGGGHAHVQVIKALNARDRPANLKITLIDAQAAASYSGMVPGCLANQYTPDETLLHLQPLAAWAGMDFIHDVVVDIDLEQKLVYTKNAHEQLAPIPFDVISMDIGSTSRDLNVIPGARKYTIPTRPIDKLIKRLERARLDWQEDHIEQEQKEQQSSAANLNDDGKSSSTCSPERPRIVVVGGGAAGIELSMVMESRWHDMRPHVTLLDGGTELMPRESKVARNKLNEILHSKNIHVLHDCTVKCVEEDGIVLDTGKVIPFTHCIWATGAGAHPLSHHLHNVRGLNTTKRGWIKVHDTLQSYSHPFVFAAGDCAEIQGLLQGPPAKAGVYAVRAGPILTENLIRQLLSQRQQQQQQPSVNKHDSSTKAHEQVELIRYKPQDDFLKLIVCGYGKALGFRFGMAFYGKWVFEMKDHIDQSFMNLFRVEHLPQLETTTATSSSPTITVDDTEKMIDAQQYDARQMEHHHPRMDPREAFELLQRSDDDVDYQKAWAVIRDMAADDEYRHRVMFEACGYAIRQTANDGAAHGRREVGILQ